MAARPYFIEGLTLAEALDELGIVRVGELTRAWRSAAGTPCGRDWRCTRWRSMASTLAILTMSKA